MGLGDCSSQSCPQTGTNKERQSSFGFLEPLDELSLLIAVTEIDATVMEQLLDLRDLQLASPRVKQ